MMPVAASFFQMDSLPQVRWISIAMMVLAVGLLTLSYRLFSRSELWNLLSQ